jgi:hypothetical protein
VVRRPTLALRQPPGSSVSRQVAQQDSCLTHASGNRYEGIVLVDQKWVVGAPSPDDKTDSKKLDKMTVAQIIAKGSKASGVKMAMGSEVLHFRAGD